MAEFHCIYDITHIYTFISTDYVFKGIGHADAFLVAYKFCNSKPAVVHDLSQYLVIQLCSNVYKQFPSQLHRAVHGNEFLEHLQFFRPSTLHLQLTSSSQEAAAASRINVHRGSHILSLFLIHPKSTELGIAKLSSKAFPHIEALWNITLFVCCNSAASVEGITSICLPF